MTGQGDERDTSRHPPVDEPLVDRLKEMVSVAGAYSGHVQRTSQLPAASTWLRLLPDRAALVLDGRDASHLGDALAKGRFAEPGGERACRHRPGDDGHRLPGILFASPCESAIPTPVEQEQGIVYHNRTRQGGGFGAGLWYYSFSNPN